MEGSTFQGRIATFAGNEVSANNVLDYRARVFWGDGTAEDVGSVLPLAGGGFEVVGKHVYAARGSYNLAIVLQGTLWALSFVALPGGLIGNLVRLVVPGFLGAVVYFWLVRRLGVAEVSLLEAQVRKRLRI